MILLMLLKFKLALLVYRLRWKKFELLFGVLGIRILKHTDNLSKMLQSPELTAAYYYRFYLSKVNCKSKIFYC